MPQRKYTAYMWVGLTWFCLAAALFLSIFSVTSCSHTDSYKYALLQVPYIALSTFPTQQCLLKPPGLTNIELPPRAADL